MNAWYDTLAYIEANPDIDEVASVVSHPGVSAGVEVGVQRGSGGVTVGRVAEQEQQRSDSWGHLGGQPAPAFDDLARVGLARLECIGALLRGDGPTPPSARSHRTRTSPDLPP